MSSVVGRGSYLPLVVTQQLSPPQNLNVMVVNEAAFVNWQSASPNVVTYTVTLTGGFIPVVLSVTPTNLSWQKAVFTGLTLAQDAIDNSQPVPMYAVSVVANYASGTSVPVASTATSCVTEDPSKKQASGDMLCGIMLGATIQTSAGTFTVPVTLTPDPGGALGTGVYVGLNFSHRVLNSTPNARPVFVCCKGSWNGSTGSADSPFYAAGGGTGGVDTWFCEADGLTGTNDFSRYVTDASAVGDVITSATANFTQADLGRHCCFIQNPGVSSGKYNLRIINVISSTQVQLDFSVGPFTNYYFSIGSQGEDTFGVTSPIGGVAWMAQEASTGGGFNSNYDYSHHCFFHGMVIASGVVCSMKWGFQLDSISFYVLGIAHSNVIYTELGDTVTIRGMGGKSTATGDSCYLWGWFASGGMLNHVIAEYNRVIGGTYAVRYSNSHSLVARHNRWYRAFVGAIGPVPPTTATGPLSTLPADNQPVTIILNVAGGMYAAPAAGATNPQQMDPNGYLMIYCTDLTWARVDLTSIDANHFYGTVHPGSGGKQFQYTWGGSGATFSGGSISAWSADGRLLSGIYVHTGSDGPTYDQGKEPADWTLTKLDNVWADDLTIFQPSTPNSLT